MGKWYNWKYLTQKTGRNSGRGKNIKETGKEGSNSKMIDGRFKPKISVIMLKICKLNN